MVFLVILSINQVCFSATLCGVLSSDTRWTGGVFSVITETGQTIATTNVIAVGEQGCTQSFAPGTYLVRFTGIKGNEALTLAEGIYGCLTQSYVFEESSILTVVFNHGRPPFDGNYFCDPV